MIELSEKLKEYQARKDLKADEIADAAGIIWDKYNRSNDKTVLAEVLTVVKTDICRKIANAYFRHISKEDLDEICCLYISKFSKNTPIEKTLFFCVQFWRYGVSDHNIANFMCRIAKLYQFTEKNKKAIEKILLLGTKYEILQVDFIKEDIKDIRCFYSMLTQIYQNRDIPEEVRAWINISGFKTSEEHECHRDERNKKAIIQEQETKCKVENNKAELDMTELNSGIERANKRINDLNETISEVLKAVNDKHWTVFGLQEEIRKKDEEIQAQLRKNNEVLREIEFLKHEKDGLKTEITRCNEAIKEKDAHIENLTERIKVLMNVDRIEMEQKAEALKTKLSSSLRLPFEDLKECENAECTKDNYALLVADLQQIFITLKRLGIDFE